MTAHQNLVSQQLNGLLGRPAGRFLLACLRSRLDPAAQAAAAQLARSPDLDWQEVGELAEREGLLPFLYAMVRDKALVPTALETSLRHAYDHNAVRNALLLNELANVLSHLSDAGVPAIVLKGAALAEFVYGDVALRTMSDLDLLVRRADASRALNALAAAGYVGSHPEIRPGAAMRYENEVMLHRPGEMDTLLEVHWSLLDFPHYQQRMSMDWFWQTAVPVRVNHRPALMLGPEAQLLHLCAHLTLHHHGEGLLWLHDLAELICFYGQKIEWEVALDYALVLDVVLPLRQVVPVVSAAWQVPVPEAVLGRLADLRASPTEERVFAWMTTENRPVAQRLWADLRGMSGIGRRLRFALANLFPSPTYMRQRYKIAYPLLVPLYYPYRWYLGLRSTLN